jgi:hypothetical protein
MREYEVVDTNADNIDGCSFCGYKGGKNEGHRRKSDWLKNRYAEGLRFKVLRSREFGDIGMIEYAPGSHAWRPVEAEGYLVILGGEQASNRQEMPRKSSQARLCEGVMLAWPTFEAWKCPRLNPNGNCAPRPEDLQR